VSTVSERISRGRFISIELLPPRSLAGEEALAEALRELAPLDPAFVAVTYGANGSDRGRTESLVEQLAGSTSAPLPHLTCAAHSRTELVALIERYRDMGVESVLALRGDPPLSASAELPDGELRYALDLMRLAREHGVPCVGVAVHPEGHPDASSARADLNHQAAKLREADFALTQFINRAEDYHRFLDAMNARGISTPVIPGLRIISTVQQAQRMAAMSGTPAPAELLDRLHAAGNDPEVGQRIGLEHTLRVCEDLLAGGAPGLHFYTMNKAASTLEICRALGWTPVTG
jgi:methylenetetrahydrofolate reductase (NADPH)